MGGFRPFNSLYDETVTTQAPIAANRFVTFTGAQASVQGEKVLGVSRYDQSGGADVSVTVIGVASVEAGAAITAGDDLITDAEGRAISHPGGAEIKAGTALNSVAAGGAFVRIKLA